MPTKAVDFGTPPVAEVALTVQFARPIADIAVLAAFVTRLAPEFPIQTLQPALSRMQEVFDRPQAIPSFEMRFDQMSALPRTWLSGEGPYLVQIQPDRLVFNWRREAQPQGMEYPGYQTIRGEFMRHFAALLEIASATRHAEPPGVDLCEAFYVNPIIVPEHQSRSVHPDLSEVLRLVSSAPQETFLGAPEDETLQTRWRIPGRLELDRPAGRLYLSASPAIEPQTNLPIYLVNLTGHVLPSEETQEAALDALDLAHDWVVRGFEAITTDAMHTAWNHNPAAPA